MSDLARLKALADGATPGPWRLVTSSERMRCGIDGADDSAVVWNSDKKWDSEETGIPHDEDAAYIAALSPDVAKALIARVERAEAALLAWRDWDLAEEASLELHERADAEDWRNDPTGSMHLHSAVQRANDKQGTAIALRDTALAALEAS